MKTYVRLNEHVDRLARVGDENWGRWMTEISKPLAESTLRYFDRDQLDKAWTWIHEDTLQAGHQ